MVNDFVFELGCEELPSASVWPLAEAFAKEFLALLDKAKLQYGEIRCFATPRRLAITVFDLQTTQESQTIQRRGPSLAAAYDKEGRPSQALLGFAESCKVDYSALIPIQTDKGDWVVFETKTPNLATRDLLPGFVTQALKALPISKPMRWGDCEEAFARPVHWALMIFGEEVLTVPLLGIQSSNQSRGHRFHAPEACKISNAAHYEAELQAVFVLADFAKRRALIKKQVEDLAAQLNAVPVMPTQLLDEVTSIVEWPVSLLVPFETHFLKLPHEVLIEAMQVHQKCFALKDKTGALLPYFITTSNIHSLNPEQVILGNEKVMRARLSDAAFFFKQDKNQALIDYLEKTKAVVFQLKLGSLYDKTLRIKALMSHLCPMFNLDPDKASRASVLSKCDLMTGMVGEFPELQGLMAYYYALHDGEDSAVATALKEQYLPRFSGDYLPASDLGIALSLVDRIDTLVANFILGQKPSGLKDPFKLRRHALAVARLLIARAASLSLTSLIETAASNYIDLPQDKSQLKALKPFILERLHAYYQSQGIGAEWIAAVCARQDEDLYDLDKRLMALKVFLNQHEKEAISLSAACKRVSNLLNSTGISGLRLTFDENLLEAAAEKSLYQQLSQLSLKDTNANYDDLLRDLASLREPVDAFFNEVMVMVNNEALKRNRLALLAQLNAQLQSVADISLLQWS